MLERQSRQEAELMSLTGGANVEKELHELLRLQRKLRTSPERSGSLQKVYRKEKFDSFFG